MIKWVVKEFNALSPHELYAILRLRSEVFVVEQNCAYLDLDNKDQFSYHLLGFQDNTLVAYSRLIPPGGSYKEASIGRVANLPSLRRSGLGKLLIEMSIKHAEELFGKKPIRIGAQHYLKNFYHAFGFEQMSDVYDEDGIEHIEMLRS